MLPEKWCIKPSNNEESKIICNYINDIASLHCNILNRYTFDCGHNYYWYNVSYGENNYCLNTITEGYELISFADFERYIFNPIKADNIIFDDMSYLIKVFKKLKIK